MSVPFVEQKNTTTYVKHKTPEEIGVNVDTQGIYVMCETPWVEAMRAAYYETGVATLQFGVGDSPIGTMRDRMKSLSSSKDLEEQKFFVDAIANPGYRDNHLHPIIRQTFAYQVSERSDIREVFKTAIDKAVVEHYIKTGDFESIREWLSEKIRQCASKLNKDHAKMSADLRELQDYVMAKIIKNLHKNGINSNIIAELAPRLGKTLMFLAMAKQMREDPKLGHEAMFVLAYGVGLSVKASYKEEIEKYQDFVDFEFIDNADDDAQERYENAIANGKFPVVFVSLNAKVGNDEKPERLDWIGTRTEKAIALLEETDFGAHTDSQIEKTQNMFANMTVTQINSSGTNIGRIAKASGNKSADAIIRVPYSMVEQQNKAKEYGIVKRRFYNMVFNAKMNGLLEGFDEDVLPNINKILGMANVQEKFLKALFQDLYGYQPVYGLNLNKQAGEIIDHTMLFTTITKTQMKDLKAVIERACPEHHVLILNGDETSNKEAQGRTFEELVALENGKYPGRDKLIVITNMMGTRSYSVPQIQACLFMMEGGDVYPYMQRYSRCLTPGFGKEYGHIFDFAFDTNKTRNTEMTIAIEAAAIMEQKGISFPDAVREVMFSVGLKDMMQGKWLDATDVIARFEDNDKLVEVANALSRVGVEDFDGADFPFLAELAKRSMSKTEKSDFEKKIKTGKTYETKKREGIDTTPEEDKEYLKALNDMKKTIERAIRMLNSSASTVTEFANYEGKTYEQCLDIIEKDTKLATEFFEMFGVDVSFVKSIKDKLPLPTLDLIVERTIHGDSANNVANSSLGIVADDPALWREIFSTRAMRRKLNSNKCKRILVVAGGLGTEIGVLVELYGIDIVGKIVYNDKYTSFCNRIKNKYPNITVMQGDFLDLEFDMKFDVVVGNPPYQDGDNPSAKLWNRFVETSFRHTKDNGVLSMIHPLVWMRRPNGQASDKIVKNIYSQYQLDYVDATATKHFKIGEEVSAVVLEKTNRYKDTEFKFLDRNESLEYNGQKLCLTINEVIALKVYNKIMNYAGKKIGSYVWCDYGGDATIEQRIERGDFTIGVNEKNTQPVFWTAANNNYYFANPEKSKKGIKIIINRSGYYYVKDNVDKYIKLDANNQYAVGVAGYALSFDTEELAKNCLSYLTSKLYAWFVEYEKSGGYNTGVPKLGYLDINKKWTDQDVYDYYNLTQEEIDYIEANVK